MHERDYIMRMIQQLSVVMAKVLFNQELKQYDRAHAEIDAAFRTLLKMESGELYETPIDELVARFDTPELGWQGFIAAAELFYKDAEISELNGEPEAFFVDSLTKALRLYLEGFERAEISMVKVYAPKVRQALQYLSKQKSAVQVQELQNRANQILNTLETEH